MDTQFINLVTILAADYNCGAYGSSTYTNGDPCQTTTGTATGTGGGLAYTGLDVLVPLTLGVLLIVAAIIMFVRNLRRKQTS